MSLIPRFTSFADHDLEVILAHSYAEFGLEAMNRYELLINAAIHFIANNPAGIGSTARIEVGDDTYFFHLSTARMMVPPNCRVGRSRHYIVYRIDGDVLIIGRILHDATDPKYYLVNDVWK